MNFERFLFKLWEDNNIIPKFFQILLFEVVVHLVKCFTFDREIRIHSAVNIPSVRDFLSTIVSFTLDLSEIGDNWGKPVEQKLYSLNQYQTAPHTTKNGHGQVNTAFTAVAFIIIQDLSTIENSTKVYTGKHLLNRLNDLFQIIHTLLGKRVNPVLHTLPTLYSTAEYWIKILQKVWVFNQNKLLSWYLHLHLRMRAMIYC